MSKIRDAIKDIEQMQANADRLAEASRRLEEIESDVRRLRQSHTDLLAALRGLLDCPHAISDEGIAVSAAYCGECEIKAAAVIKKATDAS